MSPTPQGSSTKKSARWLGVVVGAVLIAPMLIVSHASAVARIGTSTPATNQSKATTKKTCKFKPNATNTGARGDRVDSPVTQLGNGDTLEDANVSSLEISGSDVLVKNVAVAGNIFVSGGSSNVKISHVTTQGVGISSASNVLVQYANIGYSPGDAIHVTSDAGSLVTDVTLRYNFINHPRVTDGSHYDGTQVRGVDQMLIKCSTYRPGTYRNGYNANIYLENANGGDSHVTVHHNWLSGNAFSVMVDAVSASFTGNRIGAAPHWDTCYLGTSSGSGGFHSARNIFAATGRHADLCGQG